MAEPLVTVIMAAFNLGSNQILDLAIESIVKQSMTDWELLVCDDASSDGTYERLIWWEKQERRIHVVRNECNRKAAAARNRCLQQARGKYIAIMDADDACTSNRFDEQVRFLQDNPQVSFVGVRGERFFGEPGDTDKPYWFCREPEAKDFLMTLPFVHASIMFRREAIERVNGYDESGRAERSEDYDMLLRMYAKGLRGANISGATYFIREDEGAFRRRKYRYRLGEMIIKFRGFSALGLMPKGFLFAIKPLIVGLLPLRLLERLKKNYYERRTELS